MADLKGQIAAKQQEIERLEQRLTVAKRELDLLIAKNRAQEAVRPGTRFERLVESDALGPAVYRNERRRGRK